jgi:hypothetical protein
MERPTGSPKFPRDRAVGLHERLEQPAELLGVQPDSGVGHGERDPRGAFTERRAVDVNSYSATFGKLDGIAEKVEQDLPHSVGIADERVLRA